MFGSRTYYREIYYYAHYSPHKEQARLQEQESASAILENWAPGPNASAAKANCGQRAAFDSAPSASGWTAESQKRRGGDWGDPRFNARKMHLGLSQNGFLSHVARHAARVATATRNCTRINAHTSECRPRSAYRLRRQKPGPCPYPQSQPPTAQLGRPLGPHLDSATLAAV